DRGRGDLGKRCFQAAAEALASQGVKTDKIAGIDLTALPFGSADGRSEAAAIEDFFRARLRGIFESHGLPTQDARAPPAQPCTDPIDALARAKACAKISKEAREVFKRVANILDDATAKKIAIGDKPDPAKFVHAAERELHAAVEREQRAMA